MKIALFRILNFLKNPKDCENRELEVQDFELYFFS